MDITITMDVCLSQKYVNDKSHEVRIKERNHDWGFYRIPNDDLDNIVKIFSDYVYTHLNGVKNNV